MPRVLNKETGREWHVCPGHFSLTDPVYEVLPEPEPEAAPAADAEPEPAKLAPRARKNARKE